jgi:aspartate racemase
MFEAPSVGELARVIRRGGWSQPASLVLAVQPRGSNPPLFCAASPYVCYQLAAYLGADQPIYELKFPIPDGDALPFPQIKELASRAATAIRAIQPEGPYFVGGFSFWGGGLSLEIARQFLEQGDDVGLLVLFDFVRPGALNPDGPLRGPLSERLGYHARQMRHLGLNGQVAYATRLVGHVSQRRLKLPGVVRRAVYKAYQITARNVPKTLQDRAWARGQSVYDGVGFDKRSFPSRITLLRAKDRQDVLSEDLGWGEIASGGLEIHDIPGSHKGMFREPNIKELADRLGKSLAKARNNGNEDVATDSQASERQR